MESAIRFALEPLESRRLLSASIGGTVYNDSNGNHLRDAGENGIAGAQIYLDLNGIDTLVAGDPEATTDANGGYSFNGLSGGNYLVRPVPTANKVTTTPVWGGKYFVQLGANQNVIGDDFGSQVAGSPNFKVNDRLMIAGSAGGLATLSRYNADGSSDVGFGTLGTLTLPPEVVGQPVSVVPNGEFLTINYPTVAVTISPAGYVSTSPFVIGPPIGAPTGLSAIPTSPTSVKFGFSDLSTNDARNYFLEISDTATGNFVPIGSIAKKAGEFGLFNFTVGNFLPNATSYVRVYAQVGASTSSITGPLSFTTPGLPVQNPGISGSLYEDLNGDQQRTVGERGFPDLQVYLDLNGVDQYVPGDPVSTTNWNGEYTFTGLASGNYLVRPVPVARSVITSPIWGGKYYVPYTANQNVPGRDFAIEAFNGNATVVNNQAILAEFVNGYSILNRYNADGSPDLTFGTMGTVSLTKKDLGVPYSIIAQSDNIVVSYGPFGAVFTLDQNGKILSVVGLGFVPNRPAIEDIKSVSPTELQLTVSDDSTNVKGFTIQRSDGQFGPWSTVGVISGMYSPFSGSATFSDTGLKGNTTYFYQVYAFNDVGQSLVSNGWSTRTLDPNRETGSISGHLFNDVHLDGVEDPINFPRIQPQVYLDLTGLGEYVAGDPVGANNGNDNYTFAGLAAGNYIVRLMLDTTTVTTTPLWGGKHFIQLTKNQAVTGVDFGYANFSHSDLPSQARQSDGKLILGTYDTHPALRRFNIDGSSDPSFGTLGFAALKNQPSSLFDTSIPLVIVRRDGSILAADAIHNKYTLNNADDYTYSTYLNLLDSTGHNLRSDLFGTSDAVTGGIYFSSVKTLPTGKLLAVGYQTPAPYGTKLANLVLKRYNSDLTPDPSFGLNGFAEYDGLNYDGVTIIGSPDGSLQLTYANDSVKISDRGAMDATRLLTAPTALKAIGPNGKIQLQFMDNSTNEQGLIVEQLDELHGWETFATIAGTTDTGLRTYEETNLPLVISAQYRVYAINGAFHSEMTEVVTMPPTAEQFVGAVFDDLNQNGTQESNEPGIPNVRVYDSANPSNFVTTDSTGKYLFNHTLSKFNLRMDPLPAGRIFTSPITGNQTFDGGLPVASASERTGTPGFTGTTGTIISPERRFVDFATAIPKTPLLSLPNGQRIVASNLVRQVIGSIFGGGVTFGQRGVTLVRYNADGTADNAYGEAGFAVISPIAYYSAPQPTPQSITLRDDGSVDVVITDNYFPSSVKTIHVSPSGKVIP